jgi:pantoate--beta-alanine ligase
MRTLRSPDGLRAALRGHRQRGQTIGLVPTMGGLHDGHLSLIRRARSACDVVVVSLFVNPTQFDDPRDLEAYPRDEARDARLAAEQGADYLFAPASQELYPHGFATTISVRGVTETLEGAMRGRGHFDGVVTVVAKLFNIVAPDAAYFGQKDAQQAIVIRRLVEDLNFPVRIEVCPTVREADGLAMSSRNVHLQGEDRRRAAALHRALTAIQDAVAAGERDAAAVRDRALAALAESGVTPEYLELVEPATLATVEVLDGDTLAVVAARIGATRLIDNLMITTSQSTNTRAPVGAGAEDGSS